MDTLSKADRGRLMSRIRSPSKLEALAAPFVKAAFARARRHGRRCSLPGRPDFCDHRGKRAAFVHGCFWHGCPLHFRLPKTRMPFWRRKVDANRGRDARVVGELKGMGFEVLVLWECEVRQWLRSESPGAAA